MLISNAVCTLGVCQDIASELGRHLQPNVSVSSFCEGDNFERFVCDGWRAEYPLRPEQSGASYDSLLQDRANQAVLGFLNGASPPIDTPADRASFALVKKAYDACMDEAEVRREGMAPVVALLRELARVFPVNSSAYANPNTTTMAAADGAALREALLYLTQTNLLPLLGIGPGRDDKHPENLLVNIFPPVSLTLDKEYYVDEETVAGYHEAMSKVLAKIHPDVSAQGKAEQLARQVIEFETRISALIPDVRLMGDVKAYYNIISLNETAKLAPPFGLDYIITKMSPPSYSPDRTLTAFPDVITNISKVVMSTSKETLQTYFMWGIVDYFASTVRAAEIEPYRIWSNTLSGRDPTAFPDRWRTCLNHVSDDNALGWIIGRFYAAKYFSPKALEMSQNIIKYVKQQYAKSIKSLDWLEAPVKAKALEKLEKLDALMGYGDKLPVNVSDPVNVLDYYKGLNISTSFFPNVLAMRERVIVQEWNKLGKPYDRDEWHLTPQTVNAYNDANSNQIAFPAAILQPPYFHADLPAYLNYAVTGFTAGHEISHGFDDHGKEFGSDGAYGDSWWTPATDAEYYRRAECFVEQYGNFSVPGLDGKPLAVNGRQTLGENIADAGGVDNAFLAWRQHVADGGGDADLPGLQAWSHDQLFFIAYANGWCSNSRPNALVQQVYGDGHAPARFRVTGPLMDSRYFRETFGCASKEPTCKIW